VSVSFSDVVEGENTHTHTQDPATASMFRAPTRPPLASQKKKTRTAAAGVSVSRWPRPPPANCSRLARREQVGQVGQVARASPDCVGIPGGRSELIW
jgi:hypothetical protein